MVTLRRVEEADRLRLLEVILKARDYAVKLNTPFVQNMEPFWAVGCILSGRVSGVWVADHTLILYSVQRSSWHTQNVCVINEHLIFKYKDTPGGTFKSVLSALDQIAKQHGATAVTVGTQLTKWPDRVLRLFVKAGYAKISNMLMKDNLWQQLR